MYIFREIKAQKIMLRHYKRRLKMYEELRELNKDDTQEYLIISGDLNATINAINTIEAYLKELIERYKYYIC